MEIKIKNKHLNKFVLRIFKKREGFTLLELLVAVSIFGIIIGSIAGTFASVVNAHRKAIAMQNVEEAGRYILEMMGKEIRMSNANVTLNGSDTLSITNSLGTPVVYQFVNDGITRNNSPLSPSNVEVLNGEFIKETNSSPGCTKVTIVMKIKSKGTKPSLESEMNLETTMAVRQVQ